jgi:H+/Cl- antiporter ClcA
MHSGEAGEISIWFFIGVLLIIYGLLIFAYGIWEFVSGTTANVVLSNLHAPVWWGAVMLALGLFYAVRFRPSRG